MNFLVTITSQGQMSIPMPIRKKLGWEKNKTIRVELLGDIVQLSSVPDIRTLRGVFASKKKFSREEEQKAFEDAIVQDAV